MQPSYPRLSASQWGQDSEFFMMKGEKFIPSWEYFDIKEKEPLFTPWYTSEPGAVIWKMSDARRRKGLSSGSMGRPGLRVYRDGLAVEVNTPPARCRAFIQQDVKLAFALVEKRKWPDKRRPFRWSSSPVAFLTPEMMESLPPDCRVLGCMPTLDAYTERQKAIDVNPRKLNWRTSGTHFHVSFYESRVPAEVWAPFIKLADLLVGVPFAYITSGDPLEAKRRTLYGQAGEFRHQRYTVNRTPNGDEVREGLEYRVLSSKVWDHPALFSLFFGIWKYIVSQEWQRLVQMWDSAWEDDIRWAINECNTAAARRLFPHINALLRHSDTRYVLGPMNDIPVFDRLKAHYDKGTFKPAGLLNKNFPEGHTGWMEYRNDLVDAYHP